MRIFFISMAIATLQICIQYALKSESGMGEIYSLKTIISSFFLHYGKMLLTVQMVQVVLFHGLKPLYPSSINGALAATEVSFAAHQTM